MSLQDYYNEFRCGYWADPSPEHCLCRGKGWALSDVDTWHKCPIHYNGQNSPEEVPESYSEEEPNPEEPKQPESYLEEEPKQSEELPDLPF